MRDPAPDPALYLTLADKAARGVLTIEDMRHAWGRLPRDEWTMIAGWQSDIAQNGMSYDVMTAGSDVDAAASSAENPIDGFEQPPEERASFGNLYDSEAGDEVDDQDIDDTELPPVSDDKLSFDHSILDPGLLQNVALTKSSPPDHGAQFSAQFDHIGPVEFSKQVTKFGVWLETQHHDGRAIDIRSARTLYDFLQGRLSFWLGYQTLPPEAHGNLLSAASILYQGANNAGIINVRGMEDIPSSMLDVAAGSMLYEGPNVSLAMRNAVAGAFKRSYPEFYSGSRGKYVGLGGYIDGADHDVVWGRGIQKQGGPWENFLQRLLPKGARLPPGHKTWDFFDEKSGLAISAKTLDTTTYNYARNPRRIFSRLKKYIDVAAAHGEEIALDGRSARLTVRQIQVAVPQYTSAEQWQQIRRALFYGRKQGVSVVVTKLR